VQVHALPTESGTPSVVSEIARAVFPSSSWSGFMYWAVQVLTLFVLVLAANTSFQGFPRLAALLARDGFFAKQFTNLGDRLVYSNGIVVLAAVASLLIWIYHADVNSLIHLYVIGVFTAFTLSQAGMVRYWLRTHDRGWRRSALVNTVGASATGMVTAIVISTKFAEGAWIVIVAIPVLVLLSYGVRRHYRRIARRLRAGAAAVRAAGMPHNKVLLLAEDVDVAAEGALWYARLVANGNLRALHVPGRRTDSGVPARWFDLANGSPRLEVLRGDEGGVDAVLQEIWKLPRGEGDFVTVVVPEQFRRRSLLAALRRSTFRLKLRLLWEPGVVVTDVPAVSDRHAPEGLTPHQLVVRVLVSGVNAASMRAVNYARSLGVGDARAVFFAFDPDEARAFKREWAEAGVAMTLEVTDAPYRDVGDPLLAYLREITADPDVAVNVVLPEVVLPGWRRALHNQRALYVKRMLLFEPHVILSSVPYQLFR
jgi:Amino acid permease